MASKYAAVLTAKQERQAGVSSANVWYTSGNSGKDLWKLKANNPELFKKPQGCCIPDAPPGFEETEKVGWYYNSAEKIFLETSTQKYLWFDEETGEHKELYKGEDFRLNFNAGAASLAEAGTKNAPKTVVIPDLHRVAAALKVDLGHVDKPSCMLGVFAGELAARGFHEKLVKRLAQNRSRWLDAEVGFALEDTLKEFASTGAMSVVIVLGHRVCGCASAGAAFRLSLRTTSGEAPCVNTIGEAKPGKARLLALKEVDTVYAAALLGPGEALELDFERVLAPQLSKRWPRTGSISVLRSLRSSGVEDALALCCARLLPEQCEHTSKRLKVGPSSPIFTAGTSSSNGNADQVRLRQILLRVAVSGPPIMDPIRRKQVKRSQEEAEAQMLEILLSLEADGMKSFQKVCREVSECPSALKGGELAGDMGWLDRVKGVGIQQDKAKQGVRPQVPAAVLKAAFKLAVGEVHDLVSTEVGVHLLQRTA